MENTQATEKHDPATEGLRESKALIDPTVSNISTVTPPRKSRVPKKDQTTLTIGKRVLADGFLARAVLITEGPGKENKRQMELLLGGLIERYAPVGQLEKILVEKIAIPIWRQRRVYQSEIGRIRGQLHTYMENRVWSEFTRELQDSYNPLDTGSLARLIQYPSGLQRVIHMLEQALQFLETLGRIPDGHAKSLVQLFGGTTWTLGAYCNACSSSAVLAEDTLQQDSPEYKECTEIRKLVPGELRNNIQTFKQFLKFHQEKATIEEKSEFPMHHLPCGDEIETILQCDNSLDKQFYEAIEELERVQSKRFNKARMEMSAAQSSDDK